MILGVGTDLIEIARIAESIRPVWRALPAPHLHPARDRVLPAQEERRRELCRALRGQGGRRQGPGHRDQPRLSWLELEVTRDPSGKPSLQLSGRAAERAAGLGVARVSLSLTHSGELALAVVVMEG